MFSAIKDFLVPEVEPEAGFHYSSFKQVELSRDNSQTADRWTPHSFAGPSVHQGPVKREEEDLGQKAESWAPVPLHSGQTLQGLRLATCKEG